MHNKKGPLLLYSAGAEVQEIFETIPENGEDFADTKLAGHFAQSHNIDQFRQHSVETLEEFHSIVRKRLKVFREHFRDTPPF